MCQKVECAYCHRELCGRVPKGGTGDFMYPYRHVIIRASVDKDGKTVIKRPTCPGVRMEAHWV